MNIIIVGGGQVGSYVANSLMERGHKVMIIEKHTDKFEKLKAHFPEDILIKANGTDPVVLENAGINKADAVAAVTGMDEVNLVVSTLAKMEFGVPKVVARVNDPRNKWLFGDLMGVDYQINQAEMLAHQIVDEDILTR